MKKNVFTFISERKLVSENAISSRIDTLGGHKSVHKSIVTANDWCVIVRITQVCSIACHIALISGVDGITSEFGANTRKVKLNSIFLGIW